jgi:serine protease Do
MSLLLRSHKSVHRSSVASVCFALLLQLTVTTSLRSESFLPDTRRTNGTEILSLLAPVRKQAVAATVQIGKSTGNTLSGVIVSPEGYILTQASETTALKPLRIFLPDGTTSEARIVHREESLNLLLLKIEKQGLAALTWGESLKLKAGQWLCALTSKGKDIRLGVVSAKLREIPDSGAVLGIRFGPGEDSDKHGVAIEEVAGDGPAEKAGLQAEDIIISLNDEVVHQVSAVKKIIGTKHVGDSVKVRYLRDGKERECEVLLASKSHVMMNWSGEDFANHGTSVRTDNFPLVLQHDLPLGPADMGGALFDLEGKAVGLNIARVDRVTNYALPVEVFLSKLQSWMEKDKTTISQPTSTN